MTVTGPESESTQKYLSVGFLIFSLRQILRKLWHFFQFSCSGTSLNSVSKSTFIEVKDTSNHKTMLMLHFYVDICPRSCKNINDLFEITEKLPEINGPISEGRFHATGPKMKM